MTSDWRPCTLGEVIAINPEGTKLLDDNTTIKYIDLSSVSRERGIDTSLVNEYLYRDAPGRARRLVRENDVLVATVRPYLRGFGQVGKNLDAQVASTGFAVLRAGEHAEPGFVWLLVESEGFVAHLMARATGSNYPAVRPEDVASFPLLLPSLPEQRRIVDLLRAVDEEVHVATERLLADATQMLKSVLHEHVSRLAEAPGAAVRELLVVAVGGVWGKPPGTSDIDVAALGPATFSTALPILDIHATALRSVTQAQYQSRRVQPGDIVLERSGGGPEQPVGRVVVATEEAEQTPCIPTDFMRLLRPDADRVCPRYLFWRLWNDWSSGVTKAFERRTTGIRNLATRNYLDRPIALPVPQEQVTVAKVADQLLEVQRASLQQTERCGALRESLLSDLLLGGHVIPESYDRFLEAV